MAKPKFEVVENVRGNRFAKLHRSILANAILRVLARMQ